MSHGGGKSEGKGALLHYLLDNKVSPKVMAKMLSIIILFNYIPDGTIFEEAMEQLSEEFGEYINDHLKRNYLDGKIPRKLSGQAAGEQG